MVGAKTSAKELELVLAAIDQLRDRFDDLIEIDASASAHAALVAMRILMVRVDEISDAERRK